MNEVTSYYSGNKGKEYFAFRKKRRNPVMQRLNADFIQKLLPATENKIILDFGCGTGDILANIPAKERIGIEVSEQATQEAEKNGLTVFNDFPGLKTKKADMAFSYHAIEHVPYPLEALKGIKKALKKDSHCVIIVPCENPHAKPHSNWVPNEKNHHLHTWTPLTIGNLMTEAGFKVKKIYIRPTGYMEAFLPLHKIPPLFYLLRRIIAVLRDRYEVVAIAES